MSKELLAVAWCVKFVNNIYLGLRDLLEKFRIGRTETPDNAMINLAVSETERKLSTVYRNIQWESIDSLARFLFGRI